MIKNKSKRKARELTGELYFAGLFILFCIIYTTTLFMEGRLFTITNWELMLLISVYVIGMLGLVDGFVLKQQVYDSIYSFMLRQRHK